MMVPATNNGNESANGRFANDFGVHPSFWNFLLTMSDELERVERDIPSILYNSLSDGLMVSIIILRELQTLRKSL